MNHHKKMQESANICNLFMAYNTRHLNKRTSLFSILSLGLSISNLRSDFIANLFNSCSMLLSIHHQSKQGIIHTSLLCPHNPVSMTTRISSIRPVRGMICELSVNSRAEPPFILRLSFIHPVKHTQPHTRGHTHACACTHTHAHTYKTQNQSQGQ